MTEPDPPTKKSEEMRNFRVDVTLIIVGLFLALGIQSIVLFIAISFPRIDAYFLSRRWNREYSTGFSISETCCKSRGDRPPKLVPSRIFPAENLF